MTVIAFPESHTWQDRIASERIAVGAEYSRAKTDKARYQALLKFNALRVRQAELEAAERESR